MPRILLGVICGLVFGIIDIAIMLSMSFPDKKAAITAAFIARFGIGFVIGAARLPWPGWAVGLCFGLLLSIPDALITKAYAPIIGMGAVGGTIIGVIVELTRPDFCTKWNVSVTPLLIFVRRSRRGCGDVGNGFCFPHLHAPVLG
jgi:hypothetical protein